MSMIMEKYMITHKKRNNILHPSPYTGLESCEVCWADEEETSITIYDNVPYCDVCLDRQLDFEKGNDEL